jgi:hypothetical protein
LELSEADRNQLVRVLREDLPLYTETELEDLLRVFCNQRDKRELDVELPHRLQEAYAKGDMALYRQLTERKMNLIQRMRPLRDVSQPPGDAGPSKNTF